MDQEIFKILSNTYYQQNKDHIIELNKKYYREHIDEKKIYNKEKHKKERKERNDNKTEMKIYNRKLVMAVNDGTNIVKFTF